MGRKKRSDQTERERWLARLVTKHGVTIQEVADALGRDRSTLHRWAAAEDKPGGSEHHRKAARARHGAALDHAAIEQAAEDAARKCA